MILLIVCKTIHYMHVSSIIFIYCGKQIIIAKCLKSKKKGETTIPKPTDRQVCVYIKDDNTRYMVYFNPGTGMYTLYRNGQKLRTAYEPTDFPEVYPDLYEMEVKSKVAQAKRKGVAVEKPKRKRKSKQEGE